jgi:hypothetical protein
MNIFDMSIQDVFISQKLVTNVTLNSGRHSSKRQN